MEPIKPLPDAEEWFRPEHLNLPEGVTLAPGRPWSLQSGKSGA